MRQNTKRHNAHLLALALLYSFLLFITFISQDFLLGLQVRYAAFYTEVCVECISDWNVAPQEVVRV